MSPVKESKLTNERTSQLCDFLPSTHLRWIWLPLWLQHKSSFGLYLSLALGLYHLLPRAIKYANGPCWDCHSDRSHSNIKAKQVVCRAGSLCYTMCSQKLGPGDEITRVCFTQVLSGSPEEESEDGEKVLCPTFYWLRVLYTDTCVCV